MRRVLARPYRWRLLLVPALLLVAACGRDGPLRLPDRPPPEPPAAEAEPPPAATESPAP